MHQIYSEVSACNFRKLSICFSVRQGGVLSPYLFSMFIDDLVKYVNKANVGCRIRAICTAIYLYADDVILLAPSVSALQVLVGIWAAELLMSRHGYKREKSACMRFGQRHRNTCLKVVASGHSVKWAESAKYLGVYLVSSTRFKCSFSNNKAESWFFSRHSIVGLFMER